MNMNVSELCNVPREVTLGNFTFKIRRLNIQELFGFFEEKIRAKKIREAQQMASIMEPQDRTSFMVSVWKELPSGTELTDQVTDLMTSVDGVYDMLYLAGKDFGITLEDIRGKVTIDMLPEISPIVSWITGMGENEAKTIGDLEKKTETETKVEVVEEK